MYCNIDFETVWNSHHFRFILLLAVKILSKVNYLKSESIEWGGNQRSFYASFSDNIWHVYGLGKIGVLLWSDTYCGKVWTSWRKVEHAKQISWYLQAMSGNKFALELFSYWFLVSLSNRNLYRVSFYENQEMI